MCGHRSWISERTTGPWSHRRTVCRWRSRRHGSAVGTGRHRRRSRSSARLRCVGGHGFHLCFVVHVRVTRGTRVTRIGMRCHVSRRNCTSTRYGRSRRSRHSHWCSSMCSCCSRWHSHSRGRGHLRHSWRARHSCWCCGLCRRWRNRGRRR